MRYVLFVCVDPTGEPTDESPRAWVETWNGRGVRIEGMPLRPPAQGKTIRVRGGEVLVTDGPFAELAEWIAGYDLIDASDLDEAIEVARSHPMSTAGLIEIHPVDDVDLGPGTESVPHDGDAPTSRFLGLFWEDPSAPPCAAAPETVAAWVIDAGWTIRLSMPPRLSARLNRSTASSTVLTASRPPLSSKLIIAPKPACWRLARSCCGWVVRPG